MSDLPQAIKFLLAVCFSLVVASVAQAQATRTWVSGVGDDANPCSRTAPCKTFAGAISKTAKDGEISVLDPGGYGTVTITKSIYINGTHGAGYGSILASGTNGVIINITDAADVKKAVRLRSLDINGAPTSAPGLNGVRIIAANEVHVEDCVIDGFIGAGAGNGNGIVVAETNGVNLFVNDTDIHKCTTAITLSTTSLFAVAQITNSRLVSNGTGLSVGTGAVVNVKDSEVSANTTGVIVNAANGSCNLEGSLIANNLGTALNASVSGAKIRISGNQI